MTRILLTALLIGIFTLGINVQQTGSSEPPATEWTRTYGGADYDFASSVVVTDDGGYALAGTTWSFGANGPNFWLVKVDASGNVQWNKAYDRAYDDGAYSVVVTGDGGYALAGYTWSNETENYDFWLVKVDASGNVQWNKAYGEASDDGAYSVVVTGDGGYALAGYTWSNETESYDFWLVKVDSFGNVQWNKTYGGAGADGGSSVVVTDDDGYLLLGSTASLGAGDYDFWLVKVDSFGNVQWNKTYGGVHNDVARSIMLTGDGGYALAGSTASFGAGSYDFWLVKVDASGNVQWNQTYGGSNDDVARSVVVAGDGGYTMTGMTWSYGAGSYDFWLVKVDASGNVQWNQTYGGVDGDNAFSLAATADGGYALAGYTASFGAGGYDFWLVKVAGTEGYILTITATAGGTTSPAPGTYAYVEGSSVQVTAIPNTRYVFDHWELDGSNVGAANPISITMDTDHVLRAVFVYADIHDVAVTDVTPSRTAIGQGYTTSINITVANQGSYTETFNLTVYANTAVIQTRNVTITSGSSTIITCVWNTSGFALGNYTISAVADVVANETDTADNAYIDGIVTVRLPLHDVAVVNIIPSKTVVGTGFSVSISVFVENQGDFTEIFNVTAWTRDAYNNTTVVATFTDIILAGGNSDAVVSVWNTSGFAKGNYTISAYATPVPGETDTADNTFTDSWVIVAMIGDIAGPEGCGFPDGKVDIRDIACAARRFGAFYPDPNYCPNCDLTGPIPGVADGKIDIRDIALIAKHFGEIDP